MLGEIKADLESHYGIYWWELSFEWTVPTVLALAN